MTQEFIPKQEALELKQLEYNEPCFGYWRNEDSPNPITLCKYTTKEDMEGEINGQDEHHNFKNIIALAPTYSQAFRWFRENYNLFHEINVDKTMEPKFAYTIIEYESAQFVEGFKEDTLSEHLCYNHEEAELACVRKLIEIVKNKQS